MTNLERDILRLYRDGCTRAEISEILGIRGKQVFQIVKQIQHDYIHRKSQGWGSSKSCPWSSSCFTCPRPDCEIPGPESFQINRLPKDIEISHDLSLYAKEQAGE